ncbi:SDR family oxidoreductase [Burkholderia sp. MR1-5-21]
MFFGESLFHCRSSLERTLHRYRTKRGEQVTGAIQSGDLEKIDDETWFNAWNLKVFGSNGLARALLPGMYARSSGVTLNIIGMAGLGHDYNYICGSPGNAALVAFTDALGARSTDKGVRIVGINPWGTKTERFERLERNEAERKLGDSERRELLTELPFGRLLESQEIANLALFLVSDQASYLSGTVVNCDGGGFFR